MPSDNDDVRWGAPFSCSSLLVDPPLTAAPEHAQPLARRQLALPPPRIAAPLLQPSGVHHHASILPPMPPPPMPLSAAVAPSVSPATAAAVLSQTATAWDGGGMGGGGTLTQRAADAMRDVGAQPSAAFDDTWERNFAAVKAYAAAHGGDPNCAKSHVTAPGARSTAGAATALEASSPSSTAAASAAGSGSGAPLRLGAWLHRQRQARKRGGLCAARQARLEALGVLWSPEDAFWERKFCALRRYAEAHGGDPNCAQNYVTPPPESLRLGVWLSHLRQSRKKGTLAAARCERLTALGMAWGPEDASWWRNYSALKRYAEAHGGDGGSCPRTHIDCESRLRVGAWLLNQRHARQPVAHATLRMQLLAALGVTWAQGEEAGRPGVVAAAAAEVDAAALEPLSAADGVPSAAASIKRAAKGDDGEEMGRQRRRLEELV